MNTKQTVGLAFVLLASTSGTYGQEDAGNIDAEPPGWIVGLGYIFAPDPFVGNADDASQPIPIIGYIGERLTWLGPYLGYEVLDSDVWSLTAVAEVRFDGFETDSQDVLLMGLTERKSALETGADLDLGPLSLEARVDVSNRHKGHSLSLNYTHEVELSDKFVLGGTLGADWQSSEIVDYYYGVSADESNNTRGPYSPGSATNYFAALQLTYNINDRSLLFVRLQSTRLDSSIASSPIVAEREQQSGQLGFIYQLFK